MAKNSGESNEIEMDEFQESTMEQEKQSLNRVQLQEKTAKELAQMALPLCDLKIKTLEKKSKAFLIDIILGVNKKEEPKPQARQGQTLSESEVVVMGVLNTLQAIKSTRLQKQGIKENNELESISRDIFAQCLVSKVDEAKQNDSFDSKGINSALLWGSGVALVTDSIIGFENVPALFGKAFNKLKKSSSDTK